MIIRIMNKIKKKIYQRNPLVMDFLDIEMVVNELDFDQAIDSERNKGIMVERHKVKVTSMHSANMVQVGCHIISTGIEKFVHDNHWGNFSYGLCIGYDDGTFGRVYSGRKTNKDNRKWLWFYDNDGDQLFFCDPNLDMFGDSDEHKYELLWAYMFDYELMKFVRVELPDSEPRGIKVIDLWR